MKIERLLGNEYESENTVYKNGARVLSEGEQFILIGISQDGAAKILINATQSNEKDLSVEYSALEGSVPTGRFWIPERNRIGLGLPGKVPLPHISFSFKD